MRDMRKDRIKKNKQFRVSKTRRKLDKPGGSFISEKDIEAQIKAQEERVFLEPMKMVVPKAPNSLFVRNAIQNYEPYKESHNKKAFSPMPGAFFTPFEEVSQSHAEMRDCEKELSGVDL